MSEALDMELHISESLVVLTGSSVPPVRVTALVPHAMLDRWIAFTCAYLGISYFSILKAPFAGYRILVDNYLFSGLQADCFILPWLLGVLLRALM